MPERDGYETIKMIERGGKCHIVMDFVKGDPLIYWLRYHPDISKQKLFVWLETIVNQMEQYHRSSCSACYRYLNPYSIIVTKEENLALIDLEADSNADIVRNMQKRVIRTNFSPQDNIKRKKVETDIFCTGKTIQFLLAQTDANPKLSRREERQLSKLISRCIQPEMKQSYGDFMSILYDLPKLKRKHYIKPKEKSSVGNKFQPGLWRKILLVIVIIAVIGGGILKSFLLSSDENPVSTANVKEVNAKEDALKTQEDDDIYMDMGLVQFVKLHQYEESKQYFSKINDHNAVATAYIQMANYLLGNENKATDKKMVEILRQVETMIQTDNSKKWMKHYIALMRIYAVQESKESYEKILELGEQLNGSVQWADMDEELIMEVKNEMAVSYEETEQDEKAIESYEELINKWENKEQLEGVYENLSALYNKVEKPDKALSCIRQGVNEYPESRELKMTYITLLCENQSVTREICGQEIQKYMEEDKQLIEDKRFKKLQNEYKITIDEGGNIWVGK